MRVKDFGVGKQRHRDFDPEHAQRVYQREIRPRVRQALGSADASPLPE